jgi:hypothetical protein
MIPRRWSKDSLSMAGERQELRSEKAEIKKRKFPCP